MFPGIRPGLRGERQAVVTGDMVTTHAGGHRGGVLTTPSMIALMEDIAQEVTQPYLPADYTRWTAGSFSSGSRPLTRKGASLREFFGALSASSAVSRLLRHKPQVKDPV